MNKSGLYCVLADKGLGLHNSGRTYLCCHSRKYLEDLEGQQIYLDTHTLEDAWASPTRREIQTALEQGIEHESCQACWDDEHAGKKSRREHFNSLALPVTERADQPEIFDLKMGNTCNMRCRTCNPEVSSQWYREDWELTAHPQEGVSYPDYLRRWRRIPASYGDDNQALWSTMRGWIPNAVYIDYYGAEPMLIKKNFEVLEYAVAQGRAGEIDLHFSTNGTVWEDYHEQLLRNFRQVFFDVSIDDIQDRCGYIRYSSTWDLVGENFEKYVQASRKHKKFHLSACITINCLNIYYLDEIFRFFAPMRVGINFNLLHLPYHLNVKVLPDPVKQAIALKLRSYTADDDMSPQQREYWQQNMPALIDFMMVPLVDQPMYLQHLHYYTRSLDRTRGQSFETTLPEFARLMAPWFDRFDQESPGLPKLSDASG